MTQNEFFTLARKGRIWEVGFVVRCELGYCPLGAALKEYLGFDYKSPQTRSSAEWLHLAPAFTRRVADAADSKRSKYRPWLLKKLGVGSRPPRNPGAGGADHQNVLPLCALHHHEQHAIGKLSFEARYGLSLRDEAALLWKRYQDEVGWVDRGGAHGQD